MFLGYLDTDNSSAYHRAEEGIKAGDDALAIRRDTGYFVGLDGNLRTEISDSESSINDNISLLFKERYESGLLDAVWYKKENGRYTITINRFEADKSGVYRGRIVATEDEMVELFNFELIKSIQKGEGTESSRGMLLKLDGMKLSQPMLNLTVGDIFDHPMLYKRSPYLQSMRVIVEDDVSQSFLGALALSDEGNYIKLSQKVAGDKEKIREILLHELQHEIQYKNGWGTGSNYKMFSPVDATLFEVSVIQKNLNKILDENIEKKSLYLNFLSLCHDYTVECPLPDFSGFDVDLLSIEQLSVMEDLSDRLDLIDPSILTLHDKIEDILLTGSGVVSAFAQYEHSSGEYEARLTASRSELSTTERIDISPYLTNDYERAFVFNGSYDAMCVADEYKDQKVLAGRSIDNNFMELFCKKESTGVDILYASAYVFLRAYSELAVEGGNDKISLDFKSILDWHKDNDGSGRMSAALAKQFASAFEHYVVYANAPAQIAPQLATFRRWILGTTSKLKATNNSNKNYESLYPFFDRLLCSATSVTSEAMTTQFIESSLCMNYELAQGSSRIFDAFYESLSVNSGLTSSEVRDRFSVAVRGEEKKIGSNKRQFGLPLR